ncbi:MAG: alpha/beta fold hydrolase, partial [Elusimicrobiota bacterium]
MMMRISKVVVVFVSAVVLSVMYGCDTRDIGKSDMIRPRNCVFNAMPVSINTSDGVILAGRYFRVKDGTNKVVIMLHGLGSDKNEWLSFASTSAAAGYDVLIYDLRGHGESVKSLDGKKVDYRTYTSAGAGSEWAKMVDDLNAVVKYVVEQKGVSEHNIILCG